MAKTAKKSAKKVAAKKAPKEVVITRANFPTKGWGLSPKQHDQVAAFGKSKGLRNLSQVIRFALEKAGACSAE